MAVKTIPIEPGITQVVDGVTRLYRVEATMSTARGSKKRINSVRAFPVDSNGNKLKDAKHLYRNGVWADQELTTLTKQQQEDFHNRIQIATKHFARTTNAHVPSWAALSAGKQIHILLLMQHRLKMVGFRYCTRIARC